MDTRGRWIGPKKALPDNAFVVGVVDDIIYAFHMPDGSTDKAQILVISPEWVDY